MRQNNGADVAAVHNDVVVCCQLSLRIQQKCADLRHGRNDRRVCRNLFSSDQSSHILAVQKNVLAVRCRLQGDGDGCRQLCNGLRIGWRNPCANGGQPDGAVECAGVDIEKPKRRRRLAGKRTLSGAAGAVYGNVNHPKTSFA